MPRLNTTFSYSPEKNCAKVRTRLCNFFVKLLRDDVVCGYATHRWPNGPHWGNFDGGAQPPSSPLRLRWQRMERQIFLRSFVFLYFNKTCTRWQREPPVPRTRRDHWRHLGFQKQGTACMSPKNPPKLSWSSCNWGNQRPTLGKFNNLTGI